VHVFHVDDIKNIAPLWLNYTERVRDFACREPERYYLLAAPGATRDDQSDEAKGRRRQFMWMVEMYGYVFGAAEAGIGRHIIQRDLMRYTGDVHAAPGPYIIHYGIDWEVKWKDGSHINRQYSFNKLLYLSLDAPSCPRWFFPLPPYASEMREDTVSGRKNYRDALCGKQIANFNHALCEYYGRHCMTRPRCPPESAELARQSPTPFCVDLNQNCLNWARRGECENNPGFMKDECAQSCGMCGSSDAQPFLGRPDVTCIDTAATATCQTLVALGACHTQVPYMLESCRRSCEFCNASKDAFPDGKEPTREDTAAHACPDGSDLGGGQVLIASDDPKLIAKEVADDQDEDSAEQAKPKRSGSAMPGRKTAAAMAMATSAAVGQGTKEHAHDTRSLEGTDGVAGTRSQRRASVSVSAHPNDDHEHLALDAALTSWPFFLVQSMLLLAAGYLLRGCVERRARARRMLPGGSGRANRF